MLAEETLKTGTTKVQTSTKATCFGKGTGGSGKAGHGQRRDRARPARPGGDSDQGRCSRC